MDVKPPNDGFLTLAPVWVWILSLIGAVVGYLEGAKQEDTWKVWTIRGFSHIASSALAALLSYRFLMAMDVDAKWHIPLVGVAAHGGCEALKAMGEWTRAKFFK